MTVISAMTGVSELRIRHAFLVYSDDDEKNVLATRHPVKNDAGTLRITQGELISKDAVVSLLRKIDGLPSNRSFLEPNVLCWESGLLSWWIPSSRRPIYFKTQSDEFNTALSGKTVTHPALLIRAGAQGIHVWALRENRRPLGDDPVFQAPYYNVYLSGHMCTGNVDLPGKLHPSEMAAWEDSFFNSNFTQGTVQSAALCRHPQGHEGYWRDAAADLNTPEYLVPLDLTAREAATGKAPHP